MLPEGTQQKAGEWLNAPCYNTAAAALLAVLNRVYVEDGAPLKIAPTRNRKTCSPCRSAAAFLLAWSQKISEVLSPARISTQ